jgi:hypothetical protein
MDINATKKDLEVVYNTLNIIPVRGRADMSNMLGCMTVLERVLHNMSMPEPEQQKPGHAEPEQQKPGHAEPEVKLEFVPDKKQTK